MTVVTAIEMKKKSTKKMKKIFDETSFFSSVQLYS